MKKLKDYTREERLNVFVIGAFIVIGISLLGVFGFLISFLV